jgi:cell division protein FtsL
MLAILKKSFIINTLLLILIISLSIMSIHWHHQMYLLYKQEKIVKKQHEHTNAINRQLLMEYSELQSGVSIFQISQEKLLMFPPTKTRDVSI